MGSEEMKKRRQSYDKYIDRQRVDLATPTLFTQTPENQPRSCVAAIAPGASVTLGETLVVEAGDNCLLGRRGNDIIVTIPNPPPEVLSSVRSAANVACGKVLEVHTLSRSAQVTIK
jgi:hypothetical protein